VTLFTSDISKAEAQKKATGYTVATAIFIFVGFVYELFGHGIYSNYMIYAFVFPFFGMAFWRLESKKKKDIWLTEFFAASFTCCIASFTACFIFKGVIDIYGTTSSWLKYYMYLSAGFAALTVIAFIASGIIALVNRSKSEA